MFLMLKINRILINRSHGMQYLIHNKICRWLLLSVFLLLICPPSSSAQPHYLCEYDADNLLLSAPAAGGLPGLSPIVHDAPSGKVLRAGDKAFTYDAWGRVKTVSLVNGSGGGGGDEPPVGGGGGGNNTLLVSYEYDALGRRFSATSANDVRYFDWANRLTSMTSGSGTLTADHDANGNMTRLGSDYLGWNVRGQLSSMTSGGQSSTFGYDLYNRRSLLKLCGRRLTQALLRGFLLKTKTVVVLGNSGEVGGIVG